MSWPLMRRLRAVRLFADILWLPMLAVPLAAHSQTSTPSTFQVQAQTTVSAGKPFSVVNLTATAEWTAGSTHESGTAQLQAKVDGSANLQLNAGSASRTETQTKADNSRTCVWIDAVGTSHDILGPNCSIAVPWFAPGLFTQPASQLPSLMSTTDDGMVSRDNATFHQVSFLFNQTGMNSASTQQLADQSKVKVLYDSQTYLPAVLTYFVHPDTNNLKNIEVKVVFSNYQSVSGIMLPFHMEKYVNNSLQLKLDITNASIE
jgi:hypothetical protein